MSSVKELLYETQYLYEVDLHTYLKLLFGKDYRKPASFFVCESKVHKEPGAEKNWLQRGFSVKNLEEAERFILGTDRIDIYLSGNVHNSKYNRNENTVYSMPAIILDLDYYTKSKYKNYKLSMILEELEERFFEKEIIPYPNAIVNSGGGAYLVWWFKYVPANKGTLSKRRVVMKILYELLKDFGSDRKTLDAPHVFRAPETINGKNGNPVKVYRNGYPEYTLAEMARSLPSLWDVWQKSKGITIDKPKKPKKRQNKPSTGKVKIIPVHKEKTLAHDYIKSMFQLVNVREGFCEGYREMMCFFVRNYYHWMHKQRFQDGDEKLFEESLEVARQLNEKFNKPLTEQELVNQTLNTKKLYRFKIETVVEWFGITIDEQIQLKVKTKEAKNEKSKRQMADLRKARGMVSHDEKIARIKQYFEENPDASNSQAAKDLGISRPTIIKYRKEC